MTEKEAMPGKLRSLALAAQSRLQKMQAIPPVNINPDSGPMAWLESPYDQEDWELWACLLLDAFGTRSFNVANAFMQQLKNLCPEFWDDDPGLWIKNNHAFEQALAIVKSQKPRNEADAAQAAQMVALHFASMKIAARIGEQTSVDPQTASSLAQLTKAFSRSRESLEASRQGGKAKRQVIKVQKNVVIINRDEKHVHLPGEGGTKSNGQPYAPTAQRARARPAGEPIELAALPSPDKGGEAVLRPGGEGETGLPDARRGKRIRSAEGECQRQLSSRRIHG